VILQVVILTQTHRASKQHCEQSCAQIVVRKKKNRRESGNVESSPKPSEASSRKRSEPYSKQPNQRQRNSSEPRRIACFRFFRAHSEKSRKYAPNLVRMGFRSTSAARRCPIYLMVSWMQMPPTAWRYWLSFAQVSMVTTGEWYH